MDTKEPHSLSRTTGPKGHDGSGLLLLSVDPPLRVLGFIPSLFDLGHVEIVLWQPPKHPRSYGFYVAPTSRWRVVLSVLWAQSARMVRSARLVSHPSLWRAWSLNPESFAATSRFLETTAKACSAGTQRYQGLRFNCFHLAKVCLERSGLDTPRIKDQRHFLFRTLGAAAFRRALFEDTQFSNMTRAFSTHADGSKKTTEAAPPQPRPSAKVGPQPGDANTDATAKVPAAPKVSPKKAFGVKQSVAGNSDSAAR